MGRFQAALDRVGHLVDQAIRLPHKPSGSFAAYRIAAVCVAAAFLFHLLLGHFDYEASPFTAFYPAVLFAALWGGIGAGLFSAALSAGVAWWAFFDPRFTFMPPSTFEKQLSLVTFLVASVLIVAGADYCRRLARRLEDEESFRKLVVNELAHRLGNKVATIRAIIEHQLHDDKRTRDVILWRVSALSAVDGLIAASQGEGAALERIIETELAPYGGARVSMSGPALFLDGKVALFVGLIIHELVTNAVRHGALSVASGRILLHWSVGDGVLTLEWREYGGPPVSAPAHQGFGSRLLSDGLAHVGGAAQVHFAPTGLTYKMSLPLPNAPET